MEFELKASFNVSPEVLYKTWLSSEGHSKMTGGEALVSDLEGEKFTAWDGYIEGKNLALEPFVRILQSWRASEFEEEHEDSKLEIRFVEVEDGTELTLKHSRLPDSIGEKYRKGWEDFYFKPMAEYF